MINDQFLNRVLNSRISGTEIQINIRHVHASEALEEHDLLRVRNEPSVVDEHATIEAVFRSEAEYCRQLIRHIDATTEQFGHVKETAQERANELNNLLNQVRTEIAERENIPPNRRRRREDFL